MRPILLKGHERSITHLKYNKDGDLLFTTGKNPVFAIWWADNGERLGTFHGHSGAVWSVDVSRKYNFSVNFKLNSNLEDSRTVITGSADNSAKIWESNTGRELQSFPHKTPVRSVGFGLGEKQFLTVTDQVLGFLPTINVWDYQERRKNYVDSVALSSL
jgi:translation initiation factor 3 subunit I